MFDVFWMIVLLVVIIVGVVVGVLVVVILGFLCVYFGMSEVIVMIMLNYILLYIGNYIVNNVMKLSIMVNKGIIKMIGVNVLLCLLFLISISDGFCLNIGIFLVFIFFIFVWFLMKKIMFGFEIWLVGLNLFVFEYVGMSSK